MHNSKKAPSAADMFVDMFFALPEQSQEAMLKLMRSMVAENEQKKTARVGKH